MDVAVSSRSGSQSMLSVIAPTKHPKRFSFLVLWAFGLYALFLAPAITKPNTADLEAYRSLMHDAEAHSIDLMAANKKLMSLEIDMSASKVWFWRWREEYKIQVQAKSPALHAARAHVQSIHNEMYSLQRQARSHLGLWSEEGLQGGRALFWQHWKSGKELAQRHTISQALWTSYYDRDQHWSVILIQIVLSAVFNFTAGTVISVVGFIFAVPSFVMQWGASWVSSLVIEFEL